MTREKILPLFLKINGFFFSLAFPAIFLAGDYMSELSAQLSFGNLPNTPVVLYLARSLSLMYGMQGIIFWFLSTDINRYRKLIKFMGFIWIFSGIGFGTIDIAEGLPIYWAVGELLTAWFFGGVLVFLSGKPE